MGNAAVTTINTGDSLDPAVVDANFNSILNELNGNLIAITNIQIGAPGSMTGKDSLAGSGPNMAAADHTHIVQGVENLSTTPTAGNFEGRVWYDTSTHQHKMISDLSGPTVKVMSNPAATDLVAHAAQHADGAADQLSDTSIAERSMKSRTIATATMASNVGPLTVSTWTTIIDCSVTTTGVQTLSVTASGYFVNASGVNSPSCYLRVLDHTNSDATIFLSPATKIGPNLEDYLRYTFYYTVPSGGARTLRLQAATGATGITVTKPGTIFTDTTIQPNIEAVIL